jgi:hypothetical protein
MENEKMKQMARWLMVVSGVALLLGPVVLLMGAFSANATFIAMALIIMGALGLFAGMREVNRSADQ